MVKPKIGLTGVPGSGKTETAKKLVDILMEEGYSVGGVVMEPIYKKKNVVGLEIVDIKTGERMKLAGPEFSSKHKYMDTYGINREALDTLGAEAVNKAVEEDDVIVIDEIGKLDVESPAFQKAVDNALKSKKIVIITLHKKSRAALLQDIRRRDDIRILEVTTLNKGLIPLKIMNYIKRES